MGWIQYIAAALPIVSSAYCSAVVSQAAPDLYSRTLCTVVFAWKVGFKACWATDWATIWAVYKACEQCKRTVRTTLNGDDFFRMHQS